MNLKTERKRVREELNEELDMYAKIKARRDAAFHFDSHSIFNGCNEDLLKRQHKIKRLVRNLQVIEIQLETG